MLSVAGPAVRELRVPPSVLQNLAAEKPRDYPALFDSALDGTLSQYSFLAAFPESALGLTAEGAVFADGIQSSAGGFLANLERWWNDERRPADDRSFAFSGGWILFLSYELAAEIEPGLQLPHSSLPWRAFALRVRSGIVHELATGRVFAFAESGHEALLDRIAADAEGAQAKPTCEEFVIPLREEPEALFLERVAAAKAYIAAGDIYQANLSRCWRAAWPAVLAPAALYARLRQTNPAPFSGLLQWGGISVLSSSPERLVRSSQGRVHTRPIAGTRPRSGVADKERLEIESLIANSKERAEHVMLVDLERNDLGRICERGTVQVDELMAVESYAYVHHIVSRVDGILRPEVSPIDVIRATFPGGTITGCPKYRCMQLIAELEGSGRGAYTGAMGYLNLDGDLDLNILIRTMTLSAGELEFRTGAGIVADSDPARELAETRAKARGLIAALEARAPA